jgi:hypothetical protein
MHSGWKTKNKKQNIEASGHVPGASFVGLIGMPLMCCIGYDLRAGFCVPGNGSFRTCRTFLFAIGSTHGRDE